MPTSHQTQILWNSLIPHWRPRGNHVAVCDRLNLADVKSQHLTIEHRVQTVQELDHLGIEGFYLGIVLPFCIQRPSFKSYRNSKWHNNNQSYFFNNMPQAASSFWAGTRNLWRSWSRLRQSRRFQRHLRGSEKRFQVALSRISHARVLEILTCICMCVNLVHQIS